MGGMSVTSSSLRVFKVWGMGLICSALKVFQVGGFE